MISQVDRSKAAKGFAKQPYYLGLHRSHSTAVISVSHLWTEQFFLHELWSHRARCMEKNGFTL